MTPIGKMNPTTKITCKIHISTSMMLSNINICKMQSQQPCYIGNRNPPQKRTRNDIDFDMHLILHTVKIQTWHYSTSNLHAFKTK